MAVKRTVKFNFPLILASALLTLLIVIAVLDRFGTPLPPQNQPDRCLSCHADVRSMSAAHDVRTLGCATCHLGNSQATNKSDAHRGMVKNPSDLHWVNKTCGRADCHPQWAGNVQKSIMATNAGIVASTRYQWQETSSPDDSLARISHIPDTSLATSHLRKLCAGCHVDKPQNDLPGEFGLRGGGCNDCHLVRSVSDGHPLLTVQMPIATCEKCHNRSDRIGLTYQGKFESEGYGTPYEQGGFSADTLSGGRFYYHIPADIHFIAGMSCIDCHPAEDLMGDGRRYAHLEEQVHVRCTTCHTAVFARPNADAPVWKMISSNPNLRMPDDSLLLQVAPGIFLSNVLQSKGKVLLQRKNDGKQLMIPQTKGNKACNLPGHERLSCQGCHSAYTPQCYGCHDVYDPRQKQLDKVSYRETAGRWSEGRSYLRFETPTLGVDARGRIMPFAPGCQVFLTVLDAHGTVQKQAAYLTMAPFDPHSTRRTVPTCEQCHASGKRLGLGEGTLILQKGKLRLQNLYDSETSGLGKIPLEQMVRPDGRVTQKMSRLSARPFNQKELKHIYGITLCLTCHDRYDDAIYHSFEQSLRRYKRGETPCR